MQHEMCVIHVVASQVVNSVGAAGRLEVPDGVEFGLKSHNWQGTHRHKVSGTNPSSGIKFDLCSMSLCALLTR